MMLFPDIILDYVIKGSYWALELREDFGLINQKVLLKSGYF